MAETGNTSNTNKLTEDFTRIPMGLLISQPIIEVAKGQAELCNVYLDQLLRLAFEKDESSQKQGTPTTYKAKVIKFTVNRTILDESGGTKQLPMQVEAPLLSLVPVPAFTMDEASVQFTMEVKDNVMTKDETKLDSGYEIGSSCWGVHLNVHGNVTTSRENTRTTDKTAKYEISARATQQPPAEGMAKLTNLLASIVEPITLETH